MDSTYIELKKNILMGIRLAREKTKEMLANAMDSEQSAIKKVLLEIVGLEESMKGYDPLDVAALVSRLK
ncbi:hypothetical protein IX51_01275 [uncultured archaeon]|nr:hypothetical protein IX51_01275 [uncultured archaeon]